MAAVKAAAAATVRPNLCSWPPNRFALPRNWRTAGIAVASRLGGEDPESLLRAALSAASIRFQESLRPAPLFIDPYAGCFLSPAINHDSEEEQFSVSRTALSPSNYRLATKFIDDTLLSLVSSTKELRQVVLLADGMETRPYRLKWPRSCIIYDISPGGVYKIASEKLKGVGAKVPKNCMVLHLPSGSPDLQAILYKRGFKGNMPSLWALQGLPLMTMTSLKDILFIVSSLAMKGSILLGELPGLLLGGEFESKSTRKNEIEKLFMRHGFQVDVVEYSEVARDLRLNCLPGDDDGILFVAKQLRLADAETEIWWTHLERLEGEGDEEGFDEL